MQPQTAQQQQERDQLILDWNEAQKQSAYWREREMTQRKQLVASLFAGAPVGTSRVPLGNGYALKAVVKQSIKLTDTEGAIEHLPQNITAKLIRWKAELSESAYKNLTQEERLLANQFITISDASPVLELEVPKTKD